MDLELVTIGTEILLGYTVDSNGAFIGRRLAEAGIRVSRRTSVGDTPGDIRLAVAEALGRTRFVLTTGGLGPTRDDVTKKVIADLFDAPLEFQPAIWDRVVARFARLGRVPSDSNRCQAEVPRGALVLPNQRGTAPGLWLTGPAGEVVMMPGVPGEMRALLTEQVIPRLLPRSGDRPIQSLVVRVTGIAESTLSDRLRPVEDALAPLTLAYLPGTDGVDLRLTAWDLEPAAARERLERAASAIKALTPEHWYGTGEDDLAGVLLAELGKRRLRLAVAESCTGGLLGERITRIPGSSAVFLGGVIGYDNQVKLDLLGVDPAVLASEGAVSEAAVRQMAAGVVQRTGADAAIAVSGVAGPTGGTADKPVGTVCLGFALRGVIDSHRIGLPGTREEIRARSAQAALHGLLRRVLASGARR